MEVKLQFGRKMSELWCVWLLWFSRPSGCYHRTSTLTAETSAG